MVENSKNAGQNARNRGHTNLFFPDLDVPILRNPLPRTNLLKDQLLLVQIHLLLKDLKIESANINTTIWHLVSKFSFRQCLEFFFSLLFVSVSPVLMIRFLSIARTFKDTRNLSVLERLRYLSQSTHTNDSEWRAEYHQLEEMIRSERPKRN